MAAGARNHTATTKHDMKEPHNLGTIFSTHHNLRTIIRQNSTMVDPKQHFTDDDKAVHCPPMSVVVIQRKPPVLHDASSSLESSSEAITHTEKRATPRLPAFASSAFRLQPRGASKLLTAKRGRKRSSECLQEYNDDDEEEMESKLNPTDFSPQIASSSITSASTPAVEMQSLSLSSPPGVSVCSSRTPQKTTGLPCHSSFSSFRSSLPRVSVKTTPGEQDRTPKWRQTPCGQALFRSVDSPAMTSTPCRPPLSTVKVRPEFSNASGISMDHTPARKLSYARTPTTPLNLTPARKLSYASTPTTPNITPASKQSRLMTPGSKRSKQSHLTPLPRVRLTPRSTPRSTNASNNCWYEDVVQPKLTPLSFPTSRGRGHPSSSSNQSTPQSKDQMVARSLLFPTPRTTATIPTILSPQEAMLDTDFSLTDDEDDEVFVLIDPATLLQERKSELPLPDSVPRQRRRTTSNTKMAYADYPSSMETTTKSVPPCPSNFFTSQELSRVHHHNTNPEEETAAATTEEGGRDLMVTPPPSTQAADDDAPPSLSKTSIMDDGGDAHSSVFFTKSTTSAVNLAITKMEYGTPTHHYTPPPPVGCSS